MYLFTRASGQTHQSGQRREYAVPIWSSHGIWVVAAHNFPGKENKDRNQATEIEKETSGTILVNGRIKKRYALSMKDGKTGCRWKE